MFRCTWSLPPIPLPPSPPWSIRHTPLFVDTSLIICLMTKCNPGPRSPVPTTLHFGPSRFGENVDSTRLDFYCLYHVILIQAPGPPQSTFARLPTAPTPTTVLHHVFFSFRERERVRLQSRLRGYVMVCPSVRRSIRSGPSVRSYGGLCPSVCMYVGPSVRRYGDPRPLICWSLGPPVRRSVSIGMLVRRYSTVVSVHR